MDGDWGAVADGRWRPMYGRVKVGGLELVKDEKRVANEGWQSEGASRLSRRRLDEGEWTTRMARGVGEAMFQKRDGGVEAR